MFYSRRNHAAGQRGQEYANSCDFAAIFHDHVDELFTLSLLLTADEHKAEQCFVKGLDDCMQGSPVFREWAQSWARRIIIKNAIRILSPRPGENRVAGASNDGGPPTPVSGATLLGDIRRLACFERLVYVVSVLEGYSARDCSSLLGCTIREVVEARSRACRQLAQRSVRRSRVQAHENVMG